MDLDLLRQALDAADGTDHLALAGLLAEITAVYARGARRGDLTLTKVAVELLERFAQVSSRPT